MASWNKERTNSTLASIALQTRHAIETLDSLLTWGTVTMHQRELITNACNLIERAECSLQCVDPAMVDYINEGRTLQVGGYSLMTSDNEARSQNYGAKLVRKFDPTEA